MNLLFLFQQPDPAAADTTTKVGVGVFEKVGGTIGLVFCGVLMLGAGVMYLVQTIGAITRRMGDRETERQWERENVPGGGEGLSGYGDSVGRNASNTIVPWVIAGSALLGGPVIGPLLGLFVNFLRAPFGYESWGEWVKTAAPRILGGLAFLVITAILAFPAGFFLGQADNLKTVAENAAKAANTDVVVVPGMYTVYTLLGGILLGAVMLIPVLLIVKALKGMLKSMEDKDAVVVPIDGGTKSQLWSEWLRDKIWVERKQSKHFMAMLKPALVVYGVMVAGTIIVYGILCIFIPGARDMGFPFSSGGPYWLILLIPPMVCAPPFLPLFASLLLGVPMRRKIREAGTVAS
jgi:hypothetical protein